MLLIVLLVLSLIVQNVSEYTLVKYIAMPYVRTIVAVCGYCIRPLIILMFFYIPDYGKRHTVLWILTGINAVVYMTALLFVVILSLTIKYLPNKPKLVIAVK